LGAQYWPPFLGIIYKKGGFMKAINTQYKGYNFRSRLEARWAVFFDALGLKWEYEPEGFEFEDGSRYLPDFKVMYPGRDDSEIHHIWFEVKSDLKNMTRDEWVRVLKFEQNVGKGNVYILDGTPECKMYQEPSVAVLFDTDSFKEVKTIQGLINFINSGQPFKVYDDAIRSGASLWSHKGRMWWDEHENFWDYSGWGQEDLMFACGKARSARFEHGRSGN
jgi:hypothetical protein